MSIEETVFTPALHIKSSDFSTSKSNLIFVNNFIRGIPQTDECHFHITEKDDLNGFDVDIVGVQIVPVTTKILKAPKIIEKLLTVIGWSV